MKRMKKILLVLLCLILVQAPAVTWTQPVSVQAATVKNGLVKKGSNYYYYKNGKLLKNAWKTIGKNRYYFGKTGAAYKAKATPGMTYNINLKKIKGKYYGFDSKARMVKGIYSSAMGDLYAFNTKTGVYDSAKTKKLRKAGAYKKTSEDLRKLLGKPLKTAKNNSCFDFGGDGYTLTYKYFRVSLFRYRATGKEIVLGFEPR